MKTIIAGCRKYESFREHIIDTIINLINDGTITECLCGEALGADSIGKSICESHNIPIKSYPAEWTNFNLPLCKIKTNSFGKNYNALAGFYRNQKMADDADYLIAIWDKKSRGTKDMIDKMNKLKKPVLILYQEEIS